jgi:hypothetical protein
MDTRPIPLRRMRFAASQLKLCIRSNAPRLNKHPFLCYLKPELPQKSLAADSRSRGS